MAELEYSIRSLENGFIIDSETYFKDLNKAIDFMKDKIDKECKSEFGEE